MRILQNVSTHCYLLESAQANEAWGRYTFLGYDPKLEINCIDGHMKLGKLSVETENPSEYIRQILSEYKSPKFDYLPSFTGGLVGYFRMIIWATRRKASEEKQGTRRISRMLI